jgi:asparagine synthase (glutamine-hydrolysing)
MCGIAGILDLRGRPADPDLLARVSSCLAHRGPDEEGSHEAGYVALAQRRLAIVDLGTGQQPLSNEDGTVWVTYNGEIYNFRELRRELESRGHRFRTGSDTEVIVHAYEEDGAECVRRFRGMFAFAIWDSRASTLILARDRIGKKPLFYAEIAGQFVFASELQGLLAHPDLAREVDLGSMDRYLTYGYIPAPRSGFVGVQKLPPAHTLTLRVRPDGSGAADPVVERYWELEFGPKHPVRQEEAEEELLHRLREAVRLRMLADVPVGALLSGGVDSSLVVALMSELADRPVKTFSVGFEDAAFDELPHARRVAERYGTDHHEIVVRAHAVDVLPKLVRHYGEPYADSSAVPTYFVARETRRHVKVALTGDGGDECLAGYDRYVASLVAERYARLPGMLRRGVVEPLASLIPDRLPSRNRLRQVKRFLEVAARPLPARYTRWMTYFTPESKARLYAPELTERLRDLPGGDASLWLPSVLEAIPATEPLDRLLGADVRSYLPYDLLVKMDIATMANSLEARSPLLDHEVMQYCARLPTDLKVRGRTGKYLLKAIARRYLPAENLDRRKMGFGAPVGAWLRGELRPMVEDLLLSPRSLQRGYFREEPLHALAREHFDGTNDHSFRLWSLLWLELWHREMVEGSTAIDLARQRFMDKTAGQGEARAVT